MNWESIILAFISGFAGVITGYKRNRAETTQIMMKNYQSHINFMTNKCEKLETEVSRLKDALIIEQAKVNVKQELIEEQQQVIVDYEQRTGKLEVEVLYLRNKNS